MQLYLSNNMPNYMREFVDFACQYLGLDKLRGDVSVTLKGTLDGESFGLCWGDRREAEIQIASKQWGEPVSRENKLRTIAHELTHAHQYLTGRLKCDPNSDDLKSRWQGEWHTYTAEEESNMPWEMEACGKEITIYELWNDYKYRGEQ